MSDSLERMPSGIEGFDDITAGGLPRERLTVLAGGPGCGKTVLALQILVQGAVLQGNPGIFVAFEESARRITANARSFGWNVGELEGRLLYFVDACPKTDVVKAGAFDLTGLLAALEAKAQAMVTAGQAKTLDEAIELVASSDPDAYSDYLKTLA